MAVVIIVGFAVTLLEEYNLCLFPNGGEGATADANIDQLCKRWGNRWSSNF